MKNDAINTHIMIIIEKGVGNISQVPMIRVILLCFTSMTCYFSCCWDKAT